MRDISIGQMDSPLVKDISIGQMDSLLVNYWYVMMTMWRTKDENKMKNMKLMMENLKQWREFCGNYDDER